MVLWLLLTFDGFAIFVNELQERLAGKAVFPRVQVPPWKAGRLGMNRFV